MDNYMVSNQNDRRGNAVIRVRDAKIEEIFMDRNVGYVTISYGELGDFKMIHVNVVTLLVSQDTIIQNQFGQELLLRDLEVGMNVNAEFSSAMTASIPPQAQAFRITVLSNTQSLYVKMGRILQVDLENNFLITGNANDLSSQIRFLITSRTLLLDRRGNQICLCEMRPGQMVRVVHAQNMTFSIPPQITAYKVEIV